MNLAPWLLPGSITCVRLIPTYTVDTCYQFPPGRRTERASFVVTYVLDVRCVVYVKGLGETYMTLARRLLLLLYLLLLLRLIKTKTGQAGDFKNVDIFNSE